MVDILASLSCQHTPIDNSALPAEAGAAVNGLEAALRKPAKNSALMHQSVRPTLIPDDRHNRWREILVLTWIERATL